MSSGSKVADSGITGTTLDGGATLGVPAAERRAKEGEYNLEGLNPDQRLQTLAMQFRNEVARAIAAGKSGHVIMPRAGQNRSGVVDKAIELEHAAGGGAAAVLSALYLIKDRVARAIALDPEQKAAKIVKRLLQGGRPRKDDNDLREVDVTALLAAVEHIPSLHEIVKQMILNRELLQKRLEQDKKFPRLLSNAAFNKKLDAEPSMTGVLVFADISNFKMMNDTFGQSFVDETLLRPLSEALAGKLPKAAAFRTLLCRQGGDEFMVFFEGMTDESKAAKLFAEVFQTAMHSVTSGLLESQYILLNEVIRTGIEESLRPETEKASKLREILAAYADLECKIGVQKRAIGMSGSQLESLGGGQMKRTQHYKGIGFPTASAARPNVVWNALTGAMTSYKKPAAAPVKK